MEMSLGQAHRDAEMNSIVKQSVKNIDEWNIGLGYRFVQPVLLKEPIVLRMLTFGKWL